MEEKDLTKVKNIIIQNVDIMLLNYIVDDVFHFDYQDFNFLSSYMKGVIDTYMTYVLRIGSSDVIKLYKFADTYIRDSVKDMRNNYE